MYLNSVAFPCGLPYSSIQAYPMVNSENLIMSITLSGTWHRVSGDEWMPGVWRDLPDVCQCRSEYIRSLVAGCTHQQAAVRSAVDCEVLARGIQILDQPLTGTGEIIEHILLVEQHSGLVPVISIFAAIQSHSDKSIFPIPSIPSASDVGHRVDSVEMFHKKHSQRVVVGLNVDVKSTIRVEHRRIFAIGLNFLIQLHQRERSLSVQW